MKKKFDKNNFIELNNEFLYQKLEDFLRTEINDETFFIIYNFLQLENFKQGEFEGNQYLIQKMNTKELLIIDIVSEEFVKDHSQTRFKISVSEMIELLDEMRTK
ncbi:hypothetical protein NDK47_21270 [Brevibacillus ruminantium]|uniref:Uncharacterized protein n=1 Tax=Brevibacillus ruminantium TaxID=2950604 RepID=A0ABY4WBU1_9BACL|nr:hypothetical protein [Brevibacillus ruminantium]USG64648.1 hypothetical protein NDK47_21270 [Brevibacillus ruminantium]